MKPQASVVVELGIPSLAIVVALLLAWMIRTTSQRHAAVWFLGTTAVWLSLTGLFADSGFFADFDSVPPRLPLLIVPTFGLALGFAFSRLGTALATELPVGLLVLFHWYRLPLELLMHRAAVEGTMPLQMSYSGSNFDIVTGASALVVGTLALFGQAPRWLLFAWNALGTLLLAAILSIAIASLPHFGAFGPDRLNTWIAHFPFVWLPAGLVCAAVSTHVILWRRLLSHGMRGRALEALS